MRIALTLAILLIFCSPVLTRAQKAPAPKGSISAAEILDKNIAATGGLEAWRALPTVDAHGSIGITTSHSIADFDFYYRAPASDVFKLDMISHGQASVGHNGGTRFVNNTAGRAVAINGMTVLILEEDWLALTYSGFDQRYTRIELAGLTGIDGRWAYALRFTPKAGDPQFRYYDCQSFLLVRMDLAQRIRTQKDGPESGYKVETYYSDYRDSGGIKFPRKIRASSSYGDVVLDIHHVGTNQPLRDSVFQQK
jgi:hypothetical protein